MTLTLLRRTESHHGLDPAELLIEEARRRSRRRHWRVAALATIGVVVGATLLVAASGTPRVGGPATTSAQPAPRRTPVLAAGTMMHADSVVALKMFTATSGVAINTTWSTPQHATASYLTETNDAGTTWKIRGQLPAAIGSPLMAFLSPTTGYVAESFRARTLLMTSNAGATWSSVALVGVPTSMSSVNGSLWVTSDRCAKGTLPQSPSCPTFLNIYPRGGVVPDVVRPIPARDPALKSILQATTSVEALMLARTGLNSALVVEGLDGPNSILSTSDAGRTWTMLAAPCRGMFVNAAVAITASRWFMTCVLPGGAGNADKKLYETHDAGGSWRLLAESNIQGPNKGNLDGAEPGVFGADRTGTVLWMSVGVGFMDISTDGGHTWRMDRQQLIQYTPEPFVSVSRHAWLANYHGGLIRTSDGIHWGVVTSK